MTYSSNQNNDETQQMQSEITDRLLNQQPLNENKVQDEVPKEINYQAPQTVPVEPDKPEKHYLTKDEQTTHFQHAIQTIVDPFGQMSDEDRTFASEAFFAPIMALPDFAMDTIGSASLLSGLDDAYDDFTKFQSPTRQKIRGALSIIIPSLISAGAISKAFANRAPALAASGLQNTKRLLLEVGGNAFADGMIALASDQSEIDDNLMRVLSDTFPGAFGPKGWMPTPESWKTQPGMTPEQRTEMNFWENTALGGLSSIIGYAVVGGKQTLDWLKPLDNISALYKKTQQLKSVDQSTVRGLRKLDTDIGTNLLAINDIDELIKKTDPEDTVAMSGLLEKRGQFVEAMSNAQQQKAVIQQQVEATGKTELTGNDLEEALRTDNTIVSNSHKEVAQSKLARGVVEVDPDITPKLLKQESKAGVNKVKPGSVAENMAHTTAIKNGMAEGTGPSIVTDNMLDAVSNGDKSTRAIVSQIAAETQQTGKFTATVKNLKYTIKDMNDAAWQIYADIIKSGDVQGVKKIFLTDKHIDKFVSEARLGNVIKTEVQADAIRFAMKDLVNQLVGDNVTQASARVMDTVAREIYDAARAAVSVPDVVDSNRNAQVIIDKIGFLMEEYGINKYIAGFQLQRQKQWKNLITSGDVNSLQQLTEELTRGVTKKREEAVKYTQLLHQIRKEKPHLLKAFIDVFAASHGDVDTLAKLMKWGRQQVSLGSAIVSPRAGSKYTKHELTLFAKGLRAVKYNNMLSGMATINAVKGNLSALIAKPLAAFTHAGFLTAKTGNPEHIRQTLYLFGGAQETNRRAIQDAWRMIKKVNLDETSMLDAFRKDYVVTSDKKWEAMTSIVKEWEESGNTGALLRYKWAQNLHDVSKARWMRYGMTGMTGVDAYTNSVMGTYLSRVQAYEEVFKKSGYLDPVKLVEAENINYSKYFDSNGLVKEKTALKAFSGEINLNLDDELASFVTDATTRLPVIHGLFAFPRTGSNWVKMASSYIPFHDKLPVLSTKYGKVLQAADAKDIDAIKDALLAHNIDFDSTPEAMTIFNNLVTEYRARLAFSSMVTGSLFSYAWTGNIRGPGHHNATVRRQMREQHNYIPKTIRVPGTDWWVSYKGIVGLDPILSFLGSIAEHSQDIGSYELEDLGRKIAWVFSANFLNETVFSGIEPLLDLATGDSSFYKKLLAREAGSYIPLSSAVNVLSNQIDGAYKDVHDDFLKSIIQRTPAKVILPNVVDVFTGQPINGALNPIQKVTGMSDGGEDWRVAMARSGWTYGNSLNTVMSGAYTLSRDEKEEYKMLIGQQQPWKEIKRYVNSKSYKTDLEALMKERSRLTDYRRVEIASERSAIHRKFNSIMRKYARIAEQQLLEKYPAIKKSAINQKAINRELRRPEGRGIRNARKIAEQNEKKFKDVKGFLQEVNP